jgi:hypothetical protein
MQFVTGQLTRKNRTELARASRPDNRRSPRRAEIPRPRGRSIERCGIALPPLRRFCAPCNRNRSCGPYARPRIRGRRTARIRDIEPRLHARNGASSVAGLKNCLADCRAGNRRGAMRVSFWLRLRDRLGSAARGRSRPFQMSRDHADQPGAGPPAYRDDRVSARERRPIRHRRHQRRGLAALALGGRHPRRNRATTTRRTSENSVVGRTLITWALRNSIPARISAALMRNMANTISGR